MNVSSFYYEVWPDFQTGNKYPITSSYSIYSNRPEVLNHKNELTKFSYFHTTRISYHMNHTIPWDLNVPSTFMWKCCRQKCRWQFLDIEHIRWYVNYKMIKRHQHFKVVNKSHCHQQTVGNVCKDSHCVGQSVWMNVTKIYFQLQCNIEHDLALRLELQVRILVFN